MSLDDFIEKKPEELLLNPFNEINGWMLATSGNSTTNCNSMTISWGGLGVYMSVPITNVYVRKTRYSYKFFEENDYFTVCTFEDKYKKALGIMGSKSGRDMNKYEATGLTPMMIDKAVGIAQAKKIYVCEKVYSGPIGREGIKEGELKKQNFNMEEKDDFHQMYMGRIIKVLERK